MKLAGEAGSRAVSFAFNLVLARGLGDELFGRYSYAYAFAGLVALCGELGLNTLLTREIAADRAGAPAIARRFAPLRLASVALAALATLALASAVTDRSRWLEIALMSAFMAANTLLDYHTAILNGFEQMGREAAMRVATRVTVGLAGIAAVLLGAPLLAVIGSTMAANLLAAGAGWLWRRRAGVSFGLAWDRPFVSAALAKAVPVSAAWIAINLYFYMDNLVLAALRFSNGEIGQYSAASRILEASQGLPLIVVGGLFPVVADLGRRGDKPGVSGLFSRVQRLCLGVGIPAAAAGALLSPLAARLLYGPGYPLTGAALAVFALTAPLYYSNLISTYLLLALDRRWSVAGLRLAAAALKATAMALLAPRFGLVGAATSMLLADAFLFAALLALRTRTGFFEAGEIGYAGRALCAAGVGSIAYLASAPLGPAGQSATALAAIAASYPLLRLSRLSGPGATPGASS